MTDLQVRSEPLTYERNSPHSFFRDIGRAKLYQDEDACGRLARHQMEMRVNRNPDATVGQGGEFTPPAYLIEDFATAAKVGRHFADVIGSTPIPRTAQTVNIPRFIGSNLLGENTDVQGGNNAAVAEYDNTTGYSTSPVCSIAGMIVASQQVFDQAPTPGYDVMAYTEIRKDYNAVLENQLVNGAGSNGQVTGLANLGTGINTVDGHTTPATSPTMLTALWVYMGKAAAAVGNTRGHRPDIWLMSPRRWFSIASSLDSSNRPITSPTHLGYSDAHLEATGGPNAVGSVMGIPVFTSGVVLNNGSTGSESVYCLRTGDLYLFESPEMVQTSVNATAGTLQVRMLLHHYVAFVANLFTTAVGVVTLIPQPTGY